MRPTSYANAVEQSIWIAGAIGGAGLIIELFVSGSAVVAHYPPWLVAIPAVLVIAVYARYLIARRLGALSMLAVGAASLIAVALILPIESVAYSKAMWSWLAPATLTPAALTSARRGLGWILGWGLALLIFGELISAEAATGTWWFVVLLSVVTGATATVLVAVLRQGAYRVDSLAAAQADLAERSQNQSAKIDEVSALGRFLHNTVINTLQAVARGVDDRHQAELVQRCRQDIENLKDARTQSEAVIRVRDIDLRSELTDIALIRGLQLVWTGNPDPDLNPAQREVVHQIATEALTNSAKHSGSPHVAVTITDTHDGYEIVIRDDGVGFNTGGATLSGIRSSILELARSVDIQAVVSSREGSGTAVHIAVRVDRAAVAESLWPTGQTRWLVWVNTGIVVIQLIVTATRGVVNVPLTAAAVLAYCAGVGLILRVREPRLKMALFCALLAAEVVVLLLSEVGYGVCSESALGWLGPSAAIPVLLIAALVIRSILLLVVTWVVTAVAVGVGAAMGILANDCGIPFVAYSSTHLLYTLFLVCVVVSLRRSASRAQRWVEAESAQRLEIAQKRARTDLYWRRLDISESICLPLLSEIVAEPQAAKSSMIRRRTHVAEQALRTIAEAPAMSAAQEEWLLGLVSAASQKGIELRVVVAADAVKAIEPARPQWEAVEAITTAAVDGGTPDRQVQIRIHPTTAGIELVAVVTDSQPPTWPTDVGVAVTTSDADGQAVATALLASRNGITQL